MKPGLLLKPAYEILESECECTFCYHGPVKQCRQGFLLKSSQEIPDNHELGIFVPPTTRDNANQAVQHTCILYYMWYIYQVYSYTLYRYVCHMNNDTE